LTSADGRNHIDNSGGESFRLSLERNPLYGIGGLQFFKERELASVLGVLSIYGSHFDQLGASAAFTSHSVNPHADPESLPANKFWGKKYIFFRLLKILFGLA
jgi:hypothetical protein